MVDLARTEPGHIRPLVTRAGRVETLDNWLVGTIPDRIFCEQYGLMPDQFYAVALYRIKYAGGSTTESALAQWLQTEVTRRHIAAPVLSYREMALLFVPIQNPQQTQHLKRLVDDFRTKLAARVPTAHVYCGVGRATMGSALRQSFRDAYDALELNATHHVSSRPTFFGDSSLYQLLKALGDKERLRHFCAVWLDSLIDYDTQQHSELLETLQVYFENNGNTARTAAQLNIHRNTLAYRLNRIAAITQLDLEDADVRLNLQLALKVRQMLDSVSA